MKTDNAPALTPPGFTTLADIVETLTCARETLDLSQRAAAETIGINQSTLAGWETSRVEPSASSLLRWANGLGLDVVAHPPGAIGHAHQQGWSDCASAITSALAGVLTPTTLHQGP